MKVISFLVRIYSLLFQLLLALLMLALAIVGYSSAGSSLEFGMLPWTEGALVGWLAALGVIGLLLVFLAFKGILRFLYMIWTVVVAYLLISGYFLSNYRFSGEDEFRFAIYLVLGALLSLVGGLWLLKTPLRAKDRK